MVAPEPAAAASLGAEDVHEAGEAVPEVGLAGVRRRRGVGGPGEEGGEPRPRLLGGRLLLLLMDPVLGLGGARGRVVGLEEEVEREGDGVDGEHDEEDARDEAAEPLAVAVVAMVVGSAAGHHSPPECARRRRRGLRRSRAGEGTPRRRSRGGERESR